MPIFPKCVQRLDYILLIPGIIPKNGTTGRFDNLAGLSINAGAVKVSIQLE